jgi:hypothetical protein
MGKYLAICRRVDLSGTKVMKGNRESKLCWDCQLLSELEVWFTHFHQRTDALLIVITHSPCTKSTMEIKDMDIFGDFGGALEAWKGLW